MECRKLCGACCIAPSITSPMPGMPNGKPAGVRCIHLDAQFACGLFGQPERPGFCAQFQAEPAVCGDTQAQALEILAQLEISTR